jgi:hypothetical protein
VFVTSSGDRIDGSNLMSRVLKPAGQRAGVPWVGFHTFRHTCATMLFRSGLNAKQVQMWLGHHSPAFTLATYVHLLPDDLPDASPLDLLATARQGGSGGAVQEEEAVNNGEPQQMQERESDPGSLRHLRARA